MQELVDVESVSLPTASTGGDAPQQSENVSRGNRACGSKVGTPPPRKMWDPKRGEEESRRAHASKQKCRRWRSRGVVGVPYPTRRKNEGKNLGRKHSELSKKRRVFARKKRREERAEKKSARKKHKAARARSWLENLTFGTFNVRTAAVNGVNGIGHIDTLLRTCAAEGCDVIGLQETKRDGTSKISASGYRIFFRRDCTMVNGRKGQHGVGLAIKEEIVAKAGEDDITIECISTRLLKA